MLYYTKSKILKARARSYGLVVNADGSLPRGCGFKPRHRI